MFVSRSMMFRNELPIKLVSTANGAVELSVRRHDDQPSVGKRRAAEERAVVDADLGRQQRDR
jgi:hypothetical protein